MFSKLSLLAVVLPLVHAAITINAPTDAVSTQQSTITFSGSGDDPLFTIELNHPSFMNALAIANNVNPGDGQVTVTWPILLQTTGYTLQAVNVSNINDVFATSGDFNIASPPSFSASGTPSSLSVTGGTATNPPSGAAPSTTAPSTTRPATSGSSSGTSATGPSSSSAAPSQINGNGSNGAFSVKSNIGAVALAAVGAAVFAL